MKQIFELFTSLNERIWKDDALELRKPFGTLLLMLRVSLLLIDDFRNPTTRLRAMGLVYLSIMSIVPLLALSFALLRSFGVHNQFRDIMMRGVEPLGEQGGEVVDFILSFVDSMQIEGLGYAGLGVLMIAVISALQMVESALNEVWHVKRRRRLVHRISTYVLIMIVGPLFGFSAMAFMTGIASSGLMTQIGELPYIGSLVDMTGRLVPFLLASVGFTFLFMFMPNTRVKARPAFLAAIISAVFWIIIGIVFSLLVVSSAKYAVLYSAFASLVLFMLWLLVSWMLVLIGARGAYLLQYPDYIVESSVDLELSIEQEERLALRVLQLVGAHFYTGQPAWTLEQLASHLKVPWISLERMLTILSKGRYVQSTGDDTSRYVPGRPFEEVKLSEVLHYIRTKTPGRRSSGFSGDRSPMLNSIVGSLADASAQALTSTTLKDLALEVEV
jgi:membrane protein